MLEERGNKHKYVVKGTRRLLRESLRFRGCWPAITTSYRWRGSVMELRHGENRLSQRIRKERLIRRQNFAHCVEF
jgi:hypothetical protein